MQAGAGTADLAGDQRQRDQAAGVVGAVDVLADAHAPEDHRRSAVRVGAGHVAQRVGRDAADRRHRLGRERRRRGRAQVVEALGTIARCKASSTRPLGDDRVEHRVEHRDVGVRA
jgi:hypothetical protein